jgi:Uma2 family endonuclease
MMVDIEGIPALVIEVASKSTWRYDQDIVRGKAWGYLTLGVPELLLFDPTVEFLNPSCRGWRIIAGAPEIWRPRAVVRRVGSGFPGGRTTFACT